MMRFLFAVLLLLTTTPSLVIAQENRAAKTLDQVVAAGIALKLEYILVRVNESTVDVDFFPQVLGTLNHDAKSFSKTKSGNRQREAARQLILFVKFVYTEEIPSENEEFIALLKQHNLDPNAPDAQKVSMAVNHAIVAFAKTCKLDPSILRSGNENHLDEAASENRHPNKTPQPDASHNRDSENERAK